RTRHGDRHQVIAVSASLIEGVLRGQRCYPQRRMGLLHRTRQGSDSAETMKLPVKTGVLSAEQQTERRKTLLKALAALVHGHAKSGIFERQKGARHANIEPSIADGIQHAQLPCQL